jgi:hypothetical protein
MRAHNGFLFKFFFFKYYVSPSSPDGLPLNHGWENMIVIVSDETHDTTGGRL